VVACDWTILGLLITSFLAMRVRMRFCFRLTVRVTRVEARLRWERGDNPGGGSKLWPPFTASTRLLPTRTPPQLTVLLPLVLSLSPLGFQSTALRGAISWAVRFRPFHGFTYQVF
jgi:hypothetical protein